MKRKAVKSGMTMTETTVVVAVIAMLAYISVPAIDAFFSSLGSEGSTKATISAAMASARAIAAKEQHYAGIRFQCAYDPDKSPLEWDQYMIFIIHDQLNTDYEDGFRVVEGIKPIKLSDNMGVMEVITVDSEIDSPDESEFEEKTTFSIVFSPSGKLVIHDVQVFNKDGKRDNSSLDDIFNTEINVVNNGIGMFVQDELADKELSLGSFRIYNKKDFKNIDSAERYSKYLYRLDLVNINSYTGMIISGR